MTPEVDGVIHTSGQTEMSGTPSVRAPPSTVTKDRKKTVLGGATSFLPSFLTTTQIPSLRTTISFSRTF